MMPMNLVLVRHGESEGNVATHASRDDDNHSHYTDEFRKRLAANWRLTDKGREQAKIAGEWIRRELNFTFDRYFVSEYIRAIETAMLLQLPGPWELEFFLRERDWANLGTEPYPETVAKHGDFRALMEQEPLISRIIGGESMADTCVRNYIIKMRLHRECSEQNVIMPCHGEVIKAYRVRLEHRTADEYALGERTKDPRYEIKNGQVVHYTRKDPISGNITEKYQWVRSVCPWDLSKTDSSWQKIVRKKYTNEDLRALIDQHPQLIP